MITATGELFGQINITTSFTNPPCNYDNGIIRATANGGTRPYSYYSNAAQASNYTGIFSQLPPGTYDINVVDANGLSTTSTVTITSARSLPYLLVSDLISPSGCLTRDGSISVLGAGTNGPYSYSIDNGKTFQASNLFGNLGPGAYHIFVKDGNGCISAPWSPANGSYLNLQYIGIGLNAIVLENKNCPMDLHLLPSPFACDNLGFIQFYDAFGGTPPYTYSLDGINFSPSLNGGYYFLNPGTYTVYFRDATGLTNSESWDIPNQCPVKFASANSSCANVNGTITIDATEGLQPYTYSIDGLNFQSSNTFTGLKKDYYTIIAKDANGATTSAQIFVGDDCPEVSAVGTNATCGNTDGTITVKGEKGVPPYQFSIDGINFQTSILFNQLKPGQYKVILKDGRGNKDTAAVVIGNGCININYTATPSYCGNNNGTLTIVASLGSMPYSYSLDGLYFQANNQFTNLSQGNYTITVKDSKDIRVTLPAIVPFVAGPVGTATTVAASCHNNDGVIIVDQAGGTAPFLYSLNGSNFQPGNRFDNLSSGTKTISVKDVNDCITSLQVDVKLVNNLSADAGGNTTICQGKPTNIQASSNGTLFTWSPASGLSGTTILNPVANPAVTTMYYLEVTDGICKKEDSVLVTVLPAPVANAGNDTTICTGNSAQLNGSGGILYQWTPVTFLNSPDIPNPVAIRPLHNISYSLKVTDADGCESLLTDIMKVNVTPVGKLFAGNDTAVVINQSLPLFATDVNGVGYNQFVWFPPSGLNNPAVQNPSAIITKDITYTVIGKTANGCEAIGKINIKAYPFSDILVPTAFTPNNDGLNDIIKAIPIGIKTFGYFALYDRWGSLIFYTTDQSKGWNGSLKNKLQNSGVYVWMTAGTSYDDRVIMKKGTVILIR